MLNLNDKIGPSGRPVLSLKLTAVAPQRSFSEKERVNKRTVLVNSYPAKVNKGHAFGGATGRFACSPRDGYRSPKTPPTGQKKGPCSLAASPRGAPARDAALLRRREARASCLAWLLSSYPAAFSAEQPVPLMCGVMAVLTPLAGEHGHTLKALKRALRHYAQSLAYLTAVAAEGSMRHALDGSVVEPVSDEHRAHAAQGLAAAKARRERLDAQREVVAPSEGGAQ